MAWLKGDAVILRAWERDDVRTAWEVAQSVEGKGEQLRDWLKPPRSLEDMEREFEAAVADPPADVIEFLIQVEGRAVGDVDLFAIEDRNRVASVGMGIWRSDDRGKGYGYDALRTLMRWAFDHKNLQRIELSAEPRNAPAVRIYEKCGFVVEGLRRKRHFEDGEYHDEIIMGLLRDDFHALHPA